jgi:lipopolysaccharide transport system ATP-binding protein
LKRYYIKSRKRFQAIPGQVGMGSLSHDLNRWWHQAYGEEDPYLQIGDLNDRATKGESDYVGAARY